MDALTKAALDAERMHSAAAFAIKAGQSTSPLASVLGDNSSGRQQPNMGLAAEQLRYFKSWVYAAIRPIFQRIAAQPIHVARKARRRMPGKRATQLKAMLPTCYKSMSDALEPLDDHPILATLADPNDLMVAWSLMSVTVASLELTGQSLWWNIADPARPSQKTLLPIPSSWIRGTVGNTRRDAFIIQPPGIAEPRQIAADELVYFYYPHPSDPRAVFSPLQAAALAVTTDDAIQASQHMAFERGIMPKVVLKAGTLPGVSGAQLGQRPHLTTEQRSQLVEAIKSVYRGMSSWDTPFILDALIEDVTMLGQPIEEMDYLDSGKATKSRIFQIFGTNPIIAGEIDNANRAQATIAEEQFCAGTVNPKIALMSQTLTAWMGPMFAANGEELIVWIEEARANDPEQKFKEWSFALSRSAVTINEFRRNVLNLQDVDGGDDLPGGGTSKRDIVEAIQKVYLGVGRVITADEARSILNSYGAALQIPGPDGLGPANPTPDPAATIADGKGLNPYNLKQLALSNGHARHSRQN